MDAQVLIIGAGPVGLTLALDLGQRGISCIVVEKNPGPAHQPKMERCNARTMEIFRRLGIAENVRIAGLRSDFPMDVFVVRTLAHTPLLRFPYASVEALKADYRATYDGTAPCEPYQLISQYTLEPLLVSLVQGIPNVCLKFDHQFISLVQDKDGVMATVRTNGGVVASIKAAYVVGCDGGASTVRKTLGIALRGEGNLLDLRQALFSCDELVDRLPMGNGASRGRHYHVADDKATFLIMQDSTRLWTLHSVVESDHEMQSQFEKTIGAPVKYQMLSCNPWRQNLLLADHYGMGRVFLAGDAVHLMIPTGGLGMNSGIGDVVDLSWKLDATLKGWGGPNLLASYEIERRQIGERNVGASRFASLGRRKWRSMWRPDIWEQSPSGRQTRDALVQAALMEQPKSNEMIGAELGYRYVDSPVICNVPGGPEHHFRDYVPTTWPGARLPNVWLDGVPIQDGIPSGYSLLKLGGAVADCSALETAVRAQGAPLTVIAIPDQLVRDVYNCDLILVRPDLHVVWRGNKPPDDPQEVAEVVTGHRQRLGAIAG